VASTSKPGDEEISLAAPEDWLTYNRDYRGQRFSPLSQITPENVGLLAPQCVFQTGEVGPFESSPIVWRGKLFFTTAHRTYAIDGVSCHLLWSSDNTPKGREVLPVNRGVALYQGKLFRGTTDGHLLALDADNGHLLWDVQVNDSTRGYFLSGAPVGFGGKVFVGEAGSDWSNPCHIYAFDAATGKRVWTFDAIPTGNQPGARSWSGDKRSGGSHWSTITVDPVTRRLYVPLGNPGRALSADLRPGDNLYSNSIVVLDADSGRLLWYVQQVPHDSHDWDTAAAPSIYSQDGRNYMAVGSKDSRLYLYDRDSHKLIARTNIGPRLNDTLPLSTKDPLHVCPGIQGGVEWNGPAYDPKSKRLFINAVDFCATMRADTPEEAGEHAEGDPNMGGSIVFDAFATAKGFLRAFDAATGLPVWKYDAGAPMLAGVSPTATGLLFTGTTAGDFLAVDAMTGQKLYSFYTGGAIAGGVSTYEADGRQYIAVPFGSSNKIAWGTTGSPSLMVFGLKEAYTK
jgi:alcohol dehydrogenase (cytochrome c)